jgi:hypothetical protein
LLQVLSLRNQQSWLNLAFFVLIFLCFKMSMNSRKKTSTSIRILNAGRTLLFYFTGLSFSSISLSGQNCFPVTGRQR